MLLADKTRKRLFGSKPIVLLKGRLLRLPHVIYMRLDGLENLQKPPAFKEYSLTTYRSELEDDWRGIVKHSFHRLRPPDISQIIASKDFDPSGFFFLMFQNHLIGSVYARQAQDGDFRFGDIVALCVAPEYRGKKLGRSLLLHALAYFKSKGLKSAVLDVDEFNKAAVETYLSVGFKRITTPPRISLSN